jgi:hypothetical protein
MYKVVARIFEQIMTQLSGAESEEDKIVVITEDCIKTHERNWLTDDYVERQLVTL